MLMSSLTRPFAFAATLSTLVLAGASPLLAAAPDQPVVSGEVSPAWYSTSSCGTTGSLNFGSDGRLTVLLLGTDYRRPKEVHHQYLGERTDVMIVATIKYGQVSFAAIPRDTVQIPLAHGGTSGTSRINELYSRYKRSGYTDKVDCRALDHVRADVAFTLQTEIDYYAMVRFHTFENIMRDIRGVTLDITEAVTDNFLKGGLYFPRANNYFLGDGKAQTNCKPKPFKCHSALLYARSRHGTQGSGANSDYSRARRQMDLIMAAAAKAHSRGNQANLNDLVAVVSDQVWSDLPKTIPVAQQMYNLIGGAYVPYKGSVVFGPRKWAYRDSHTPGYTFRLRLPLVRSWINDHFGS